MWDLLQISVINGLIGSVGASTALFIFYALKGA